jgi:hypothetical protein
VAGDILKNIGEKQKVTHYHSNLFRGSFDGIPKLIQLNATIGELYSD